MAVCPGLFLVFPWNNLNILHLTLIYLICFELMLLQGEKLRSSFSLVQVEIHFLSIICWRVFFPTHTLGSFVKIRCLQLHRFVSGSSTLCHWIYFSQLKQFPLFTPKP
jgi:hypothetical protein